MCEGAWFSFELASGALLREASGGIGLCALAGAAPFAPPTRPVSQVLGYARLRLVSGCGEFAAMPGTRKAALQQASNYSF
jgi:hypothetical protein